MLFGRFYEWESAGTRQRPFAARDPLAPIVALATLISSWQVALLGYALVGLGCSNIVPVLFSSVGRQTIMPENVAIPAITTLGYAGILVGPAAIGFVSHNTNLQTAFMILALLLLGVAASGRLLRV